MFPNEDTPMYYHFKKMAKLYYARLSKELGEIDIDRYYVVLLQICKQGRITQQALSCTMGIDKASMARIIEYLHRHGYLAREVNPNDRRQQMIMPTQKAEQLFPRLKQTCMAVNNECMRGLTRLEKEKLYTLVERITRNLSPGKQDILR